jgi:hypothetical protein
MYNLRSIIEQEAASVLPLALYSGQNGDGDIPGIRDAAKAADLPGIALANLPTGPEVPLRPTPPEFAWRAGLVCM